MAISYYNNISRISARDLNHLQALVQGTSKLIIQQRIGNSIDIDMAATWGTRGTSATFLSSCCPLPLTNNPVKYLDAAAGITATSANALYASYGNNKLVVDISAPYTYSTIGTCPPSGGTYPGGTYDDSGRQIADQGQYFSSFSPPVNYYFGTSTLAVSGPDAVNGQTGVNINARAFVLPEVNTFPAGTSIESATVEIAVDNLIKYSRRVTATVDASGNLSYTDHGVVTETIGAFVSLILLGQKEDGTVVTISGASASVATNGSSFVQLDITDIVTEYHSSVHSSSPFSNYAVALTPDTAALEAGIHEEKEALIDFRNASWKNTYANFQDPAYPCNWKSYQSESINSNISLDDWTLGRIEVEFCLPSLSVYIPHYQNVPDLSPQDD